MPENDKPNIFNYATSELSQDAFICWLLSWAQKEYQQKDEDLCSDAKTLISIFLKKFPAYERLSIDDIERVINLKQQYMKADIYFQVLIKNIGILSFIVEDKTHTSHHSDQLKRYLERIQNDAILEKEVLGIYFKTGFIYDWDRELPEPYKLFDRGELLDFLKNTRSKHFLLKEYTEYLNGMDREFNGDIEKSMDPSFVHEGLKTPHGQWYLMEKICPENNLQNNVAKKDRFYNGMNVGGFPWTQYKFFCLANEYDPNREVLFYRIDFRVDPDFKGGDKRRPYFAIRQYQHYGKDGNLRDQKMARLGHYKKCFQEAIKELRRNGRFSLEPGRESSGGFESEIGTFFIKPPNNTPENLIKFIPIFHKAFLEKVDILLKTEEVFCSEL